jgi:hypothetical protein
MGVILTSHLISHISYLIFHYNSPQPTAHSRWTPSKPKRRQLGTLNSTQLNSTQLYSTLLNSTQLNTINKTTKSTEARATEIENSNWTDFSICQQFLSEKAIDKKVILFLRSFQSFESSIIKN